MEAQPPTLQTTNHDPLGVASGRGINISKLISLVQQYEPLYNPRHSRFRDRFYTMPMWNVIATELGTTAREAIGHWQNLKHHFMRERRNILRRTTGMSTPTWKHYKKLLFLVTPQNGLSNSDDSDGKPKRPKPQAKPSESSQKLVYAASSSTEPKVTYEFLLSEDDEEDERWKSVYEEPSTTVKDPLEIESRPILLENPELAFFRGLMPHIKQLRQIDKLAFKNEVVQILEQKLKSSGTEF